MKSYEVYRFRRVALRWTRDILADKAEVLPDYVRFFEEGKSIGRDFEKKIKFAIDEEFRNLNSIEHHKARILELAYEIMYEEDSKQIMQRTSHLAVSLGKLQRELIG